MKLNNFISDTFCVFCPITQNFLLEGPYFQHTTFRPQWPLPIALIVWGCGLPKIFGYWKYAWNYLTVAYCRLGNARRRAAVVAILPDNCHPSSFLLLS